MSDSLDPIWVVTAVVVELIPAATEQQAKDRLASRLHRQEFDTTNARDEWAAFESEPLDPRLERDTRADSARLDN